MTETRKRRSEDSWHLDKRVPIAVIIALLIQAASIIWWASRVESRLAVVERYQHDNSQLSERVVRLEVLLERVDRTISRVERKIDK